MSRSMGNIHLAVRVISFKLTGISISKAERTQRGRAATNFFAGIISAAKPD
jgi:hypothetical protein